MASTRASIFKVSKRSKINIISPKQLFVDLTQDDTKTSLPKLSNSSPSAPNAPSKTPSTKDTSSSLIDYIPKSPTSSTSPSPNGYLNPSTSPPPRVSPPPPTQDNASMDITLTLSPNTPLDVQFDTPSPSPPIIAHPIPWNFLEAHVPLIPKFIASEGSLVADSIRTPTGSGQVANFLAVRALYSAQTIVLKLAFVAQL
ncbi:hypothetical protein Tco_0223659 [Tanacetum coccineum]